MTIASFFQTSGVSIAVFNPTIGSGSFVSKGTLVRDDLASFVNRYQHTIDADGGYGDASIEFSGDVLDANDWAEYGLNRCIVIYNEASEVVYCGFVNSLVLKSSTETLTIGPLLDMANRISISYIPIIDPDSDPPTMGTQTETTVADDTTSQSKYGIIEKVLSGGNRLDDGTTNEAEELRDSYLEETKDPKTSLDTGILGDSDVVSITLVCLGYSEWLFYICNITDTGSVTLTSKILEVLGFDPNNLFSTDYTHIATNALLTERSDDADRTASAILKEIVALGDVYNNRYTFGVYEDQIVHYTVAPSTYEYRKIIRSKGQQIETIDGIVVKPWNVLPARWLFVPDLLVGKQAPTSIALDPRSEFIESVTYTAPYGLSLAGSRMSTLKQKLAKYGLTSV